MYNTKQHPLVAKRDIIVVKYLRKEGGQIKTPCQGTLVELNKPLVADREKMQMRESNSIVYSIEGGAIHAFTVNRDSLWERTTPYKAIIPKGTEYYVDVRGLCVAARQLVITDEEIHLETPDQSLVLDLLEQRPIVDGIAVGDFYFKDQGFMSPLDLTQEIIPKISGVVIGFKDNGDPLIWSGEVSQGKMDTLWDSRFDVFTSYPEADAEGEKHKEAFLKNYTKKFDKDRFQAYAKCMSYKPHIGEWYIPAYAEQKEMVNNLLFVNAAAWFSHSGMFMVPGYYWTSSECDVRHCWGISLGEFDAGRLWCYRYYSGRVCFFLASTNKIPKVKIEGLTAEKEKEPILSKIRKYVRKRKA